MSVEDLVYIALSGGAQSPPRKVFKCPECFFILLTEQELHKHVQTIHQSEFVCIHCGFLASNPFAFHAHNELHRVELQREITYNSKPKPTPRDSALVAPKRPFKRSKKQPKNQPTFKCSQCSFTTDTNQHLQDHRVFAHMQPKESKYFLNVVPLKPKWSRRKNAPTTLKLDGHVFQPQDITQPCFVQLQRLPSVVSLNPTVKTIIKEPERTVTTSNSDEICLRPCFVVIEKIRLGEQSATVSSPFAPCVKMEKLDSGYHDEFGATTMAPTRVVPKLPAKRSSKKPPCLCCLKKSDVP